MREHDSRSTTMRSTSTRRGRKNLVPSFCRCAAAVNSLFEPMNIVNFTPYHALAGGALIGSAAVLLLWLNGRLAGVSGIVGGLLAGASDWRWRALFVLGLICGAAIYYASNGGIPTPRPAFPAWLLAAGGLLVGFGTALGRGCTSGHGVCGLARLSMRSLAATAVFLLAAIVTTFVVRHCVQRGLIRCASTSQVCSPV